MSCDAVKNVIIWGNHSSTQFPDAAHAVVTCDDKTRSVYEALTNDTWLKGEFIQVISCVDGYTIEWWSVRIHYSIIATVEPLNKEDP